MTVAVVRLLLPIAVVDGSWTGFCKDSPNVCSDYCTINPEACKAICKDSPSIKGCEQICCDDETAECLACKEGVPKDEYCKTHREVDGCCDSACQRVDVGTITAKKSCPIRVRNQVVKVHRPLFLEMNIERDCPFETWFSHNLELCEECSKLHQPCNNTHMACGGCCGTTWHSELGLNINVEHTCDDIKQIFLATSTHTAECDEELEEELEEDDDDNSTDGNSTGGNSSKMTFEDETPDWFVDEITASCTSKVHQVRCQKSPLKVKFECDECQNQGSPVLMKKCCDRCVEFAENLASSPIPDFVKPIVWCSSCDDKYITSPRFSPMPWPDHTKYAEYTEAKADEQFLTFIENDICASMRQSCPAADRPADRRLRGGSDDSSACLAGTSDCTNQDKLYDASAADDRRLLDEEKVAQVSEDAHVQVTDKNPEMFCSELDYVVDPTHYPKSTMTIEQNVAATTMTATAKTTRQIVTSTTMMATTTTSTMALGAENNGSHTAAGSTSISLSVALVAAFIMLCLV